MNPRNAISLGWILTFALYVGARARAIPDFYTDDDLNAWHKFGLRSFYGPWSVMARKPNGDFVSYADYGARVPADFRLISDETVDADEDDDESRGTRGDRPERQYPSKYATGLSDFAAGYGFAPQGLAVFSNGVQSPDATAAASTADRVTLDDNAVTFDANTDIRKILRAVDGSATSSKESKRDTLELIGIVGVISDDGESSEEDGTTTTRASGEIVDGTDDGESSDEDRITTKASGEIVDGTDDDESSDEDRITTKATGKIVTDASDETTTVGDSRSLNFAS